MAPVDAGYRLHGPGRMFVLRLAMILLAPCAVIGPALGNAVTLVCEYKDANSKPSKRSFVWDAKAGLFDGHRIGDVWQDGTDHLELRKTEISIIEETSRLAKDGHQTKISVSIDDYGYFLKMEDGKITARGDCKKAADQSDPFRQK